MSCQRILVIILSLFLILLIVCSSYSFPAQILEESGRREYRVLKSSLQYFCYVIWGEAN